MKVLYLLSNSPQDCESYIEAEIKYAKSRGVQVEIWSSLKGYGQPPVVPVHYGSVYDAIGKFKPDLLHIHYLVMAQQVLRDLFVDLPITIRSHSFDWDAGRAINFAAAPTIKVIYAFPHFAREVAPGGKIVPMTVAFDPELYTPSQPKNRRLVLRLASGRRVKGLRDFLEIGNRVQEAHFILGVTPLRGDEVYLNELERDNRSFGGRVDIRVGGVPHGMSRQDVVGLMQRAGIYLETNDPSGHRLGMQISIAEAMATGAYVLARHAETLPEYVDDAASSYRSIDEAVRLVRETFDWSDQRWADQAQRAMTRAALFRSDVVLPRLVDDWERIVSGTKR